MFFSLLCLCLYSLYLTLCILPLASCLCKHCASSFPLIPLCIFLLPAPPSLLLPPLLPALHVPASLSLFFLTPTCMYGSLFSTYFTRMRESSHHWLPFMFLSLYTLNILCVLFCSVLLSSHGPDGPELFMIDPSGVSWVKKYIYLIFCIMAKNVVIHVHVGIKTLNFVLKKKLSVLNNAVWFILGIPWLCNRKGKTSS